MPNPMPLSTETLQALPSPKWIRAMIAGQWVVESRRALLLYRSGSPPLYAFPLKDVLPGCLVQGEREREELSGREILWWHLRLEQKSVENAGWSYPRPGAAAKALSECVVFQWEVFDSWFEEDEEVFVHPRDPYVRIDTLHSSRKIRVEVEGVVVAESARTVLLFETGLPTRYYLPKSDTDMSLLLPGDGLTRCPYKGEARYYSVRTARGERPNIAWYYRYPLNEVVKIANMICFYQERVDGFYVDGVDQSGSAKQL